MGTKANEANNFTLNELSMLAFLDTFIDNLQLHFKHQPNELDLLFGLDKLHLILDEMLVNGQIVESPKSLIGQTLIMMDQKK